MTLPMRTIFTQLSNQVIAELVEASYPATLTGGQILVGRKEQFGQTAPPRIIMVPMGSKFSVNDASSDGGPTDSEWRAEMAQAPAGTEAMQFEIRCWGNDPTDAENDYDMTRALYQAFRVACFKLLPGSYALDATGKWTDATFAGSQIVAYGKEFVMDFVLMTPELDHLLPFAPSNVTLKSTSNLTLKDGTTSVGCTS